jgi:hypothetical protein
MLIMRPGNVSGLGFPTGSMVWFDGKGLNSVRKLDHVRYRVSTYLASTLQADPQSPNPRDAR